MRPQVPVVDIASFQGLENNLKQSLANDFVEKFSSNGFIGIKGHGLAPQYVREAFEMSKKFFGLPLEDKMRAPHPKASKPHRGYSAPGIEKASLPGEEDEVQAASRKGKLTEYKESFEIGHEDNKEDYNIWLPDHVLPGFRQFELELFHRLQGVARQILDILVLGIGLSYEEITQMQDAHSGIRSQLRLLRYPPCAADDLTEVGSRLGTHYDWSTFTLLLQEDVSGLQFQDQTTEQFIDAEPQDGVIYVNAGDSLQRLSNGKFPSALHRVVRPRGSISEVPERFTIVLFVSPKESASIAVLPTIAKKDGEIRYDPMTFGEYSEFKAKWHYQNYAKT